MNHHTHRYSKILAAFLALQTLPMAASFSSRRLVAKRIPSRQSTALAFFFSPNTSESSSTQQKAVEEENTSFLNFPSTIKSAWSDWLTDDRKEEAEDNDYNQVVKDSPTGNGLLQMIDTYTQPIQSVLDESSSGWALSYADLKPDSSMTPAGQAFLATNMAYLLAGLGLQLAGEVTLGTLTDLCALFSFMYHFQQLDATSDQAVRLALLLDYVFALLAMGTASAYLAMTLLFTNVQFDEPLLMAMAVTASSLGFLGLSWKFEYGRPYMLWHSLWHLASAYSGFLIGNLHLTV